MTGEEEGLGKVLRVADEDIFPGDEKLNESCTASFDLEGYVSFHFKPKAPPGSDSVAVRKEMKNYFLGLNELASRISGGNSDERYTRIKYVSVTSWIVNENDTILTKSGFKEDPGMPSEDKDFLIKVYERRREHEVLPEHRDIIPKVFRVSASDFIADDAPWRRWANRTKK